MPVWDADRLPSPLTLIEQSQARDHEPAALVHDLRNVFTALRLLVEEFEEFEEIAQYTPELPEVTNDLLAAISHGALLVCGERRGPVA
jgi:hypothetical protein